jgi:hypothetical protein
MLIIVRDESGFRADLAPTKLACVAWCIEFIGTDS